MPINLVSSTLIRALRASKTPFLYPQLPQNSPPTRILPQSRHLATGSRTQRSSSTNPPLLYHSTKRHPTTRGIRPSPHCSITTPATPPILPTPLNPSTYTTLSDAYIDTLLTRLEDLSESTRPDIDVEYSAGVLTLIVEGRGTYVLNKQPPNRQIWLSSPISSPKRYDWVGHDDSNGGGGVMGEGENVYGMGAPEARGKEKGSGGHGGSDEEGGDGGGGPEREGRWVYLRDGSTLTGCLEEEVGFKMEEDGEGGEG